MEHTRISRAAWDAVHRLWPPTEGPDRNIGVVEQATAAPGELRDLHNNKCPHCRGEMKVHEGKDGRRVWCRVCGGSGRIKDRPIPYDQRCWKSVADDTMARCRLRIGHAGECEAPESE